MDTNDSIILGVQTRYDRAHSQRLCLRGTSIITQVRRLTKLGRPMRSYPLLIHGYQGLPYAIHCGVQRLKCLAVHDDVQMRRSHLGVRWLAKFAAPGLDANSIGANAK